MANSKKSSTSDKGGTSDTKDGLTIHGTPKSSEDGSPRSSSSPPNKVTEIRKEDVLAHLNEGNVLSYLKGMDIADLRTLLQQVLSYARLAVRTSTAIILCFHTLKLDDNKPKAHNYFNGLSTTSSLDD